MSDRPLPPATRKALDAIVNGPGRVATTAHPDCRCLRAYIPACPVCGVGQDEPCIDDGVHFLSPPYVTAHRGRPLSQPGRHLCPQHRPEPP